MQLGSPTTSADAGGNSLQPTQPSTGTEGEMMQVGGVRETPDSNPMTLKSTSPASVATSKDSIGGEF